MHVLFIGGVFDVSREPEILKKTRTDVEYAANRLQHKLIKGLRAVTEDISVVSAPFVGAWPNAYEEVWFRGFREAADDQSGFEYVPFLNIWGLRNPARVHGLKKTIKDFAAIKDDEKIVVIYSPHTPFLQAANYLKKLDSTIKTCLVIPDLPQYMNLSDHVSGLYTFLKKYDIKAFNKECAKIDTFVLLTEPMKDSVQVGCRKYAVVEGVYEDAPVQPDQTMDQALRYIVYTGKLEKQFGILRLVEAFMQLPDRDLRLLICGRGEAERQICDFAEKDTRIEYKGQVSSTQALAYTAGASVLVNPRPNDCEYTKYSFPSKTIEYLATGNPVVAYMLDGMPAQYRDFIYPVDGDTPEDVADALRTALTADTRSKEEKSKKALKYLREDRSPETVGKIILELCK